MPGEQGGDVLSGHAVRVQMNVRRPFERGLGLGERLSGPRHPVERVQGSLQGGLARAAASRVRPAPDEQVQQAGGTHSHDNPGHDQHNVEQLGGGAEERRGGLHRQGGEASPGCRSVWYRPRHDPRGNFGVKLARYLP
jgi:hypothetical protein